MTIGIDFLKRFVTRETEAYKFRKFRHHVSAALQPEERSLVLPFAYFVSDARVKVVYDVGAADGRFSAAVAKFKNITQVIAFEPLPESYARLKQRTAREGKIATHNVAVGEADGEIKFFVTADGDASSCLRPNDVQSANFPNRGLSRDCVVKVGSMDSLQATLGLPKPDLIKMDTQGFELKVIRGATDCLRHASTCIVECSYVALYEGGPLIGEIQHELSQRGWRIVGVGPQLTGAGGKPLQLDLVFGRT